jgi:hypothetical protein
MKWFTRDYIDGGLDDEEWSRRREDYAQHLNSIGADLSDGAEELIATVNLHDAQVHAWSLRTGLSGFASSRVISSTGMSN